MAAHSKRGRISLEAGDLDQLARCPLSINYLPRIQANKLCHRCDAFGKVARYIFQRSRWGTHMPSLKKVVEKYGEFLEHPNPIWVEDTCRQDKFILDELLRFGKGIRDQIDGSDIPAKTNHGLYTVGQNLDLMLARDDTYYIYRFVCGESHGEQVLDYRMIHASLWFAENYEKHELYAVITKLTNRGLAHHYQEIPLDKTLLRRSVEHILSTVEIKDLQTEDLDKAQLQLPAIFGGHCYSCMACFLTKKEL